MNEQINRLGFEAWADNLIVNAIEDGFGRDFVSHSDNISVVLCYISGGVHATVRAYVPGKGWLNHERVHKIKPDAR